MNNVNGFTNAQTGTNNLNRSGNSEQAQRARAVVPKNTDSNPVRTAERKPAREPKSIKSDPLKEITKLLKSLIESLSTIINKLFKADTAQATTAATATGVGGVVSGVNGTENSASGTVSEAPSSASTATAEVTPSESPTQSSTSIAADSTAVSSTTETPTDDLEVREAQQASTKATSLESTEGLQVLKDETGAISVLTDDGFTIKAEGKEEAWSITGPDGYATRIWGDPHVKEGDGDAWDFLKQSSFLFGNNKVTVETVTGVDGKAVSARLTVYSGDERVTVSGVNTSKPTIEGLARDGVQNDAELSDGDVYSRAVNTRGESWSTVVDGKKDVMGH